MTTETSASSHSLSEQILEQCQNPLSAAWLLDYAATERVRSILSSSVAAFPDGKLTVRWSAVDGDRLVVGGGFDGTHLGSWRDVPATGRTVTALTIISLRLDGGSIVDINVVTDSLSVAEQLGAIAPLGAPVCRRPVVAEPAGDRTGR